jgi:2-amino-4-hydroxy-6-hydroxymethyldihydropteridine diphosphokinase
MPDSSASGPVVVAVGLGSNLGDRLGFLRQGVNFLRQLHEGSPANFRTSKIYETSPVDCPPDSPSFLNAAVVLLSARPPLELLEVLQAFEVRCGRPTEHGFHTPRTLDLDLLVYGLVELQHPRLILPHPRALERAFVLLPLVDLMPEYCPPGSVLSFREAAEALLSGRDCGVAICPESL